MHMLWGKMNKDVRKCIKRRTVYRPKPTHAFRAKQTHNPLPGLYSYRSVWCDREEGAPRAEPRTHAVQGTRDTRRRAHKDCETTYNPACETKAV